MRFALRCRCARTAVRIIAHRVCINFPNSIKCCRRVGRIAPTRLILRARRRLAGRPAEECVPRPRRLRAAQRQCRAVRFALRCRCARTAVRVIAHRVGNGQGRDNFRVCLLTRRAGVGLDALYPRLRRGGNNAAVPAVALRIGVIILVAGAANRAGIQGIALLRAGRSYHLRGVRMRRVAGVSVCECNRAIQNGLFNRFALKRIAVIGAVIVLDLHLDIKIIASGRMYPIEVHRRVKLRIVQVFGSHLLGSAIIHGGAPHMDRTGNSADVCIARGDRPIHRVRRLDRERGRNVLSAGGDPVFNGRIAVIRHLAELGIDIAHRSV